MNRPTNLTAKPVEIASAIDDTRPIFEAPTDLRTKPTSAASAMNRTRPSQETPALEMLRTLGRILDDLEKNRVGVTNRIGAMERDRGEALPHLYEIATPVETAEHLAELELIRAWRKHPLAGWAKQYRGLGEKSIARLIAEIGDPATGSTGHWENPDSPERKWVVDSEYERTVSQLWQFCGVGDPARIKIPKGATQAELLKRGKPRAKKQLWLISTSMLKAGNRAYYDAARAKYENRDWTDGHKHNAALRYVAKAFLKDLWVAARHAWHETHEYHAGHNPDETRSESARHGNYETQFRDAGHPTDDAHSSSARPWTNGTQPTNAGHELDEAHRMSARQSTSGTRNGHAGAEAPS